YGYGFGDDHINRVLHDMLANSSTHLVIISYDGGSGRIERFCARVGRPAQISLMIGNHFGDLSTLVDQYLPTPAIDPITERKLSLHRSRKEAEDLSTSDEPSPTEGDVTS